MPSVRHTILISELSYRHTALARCRRREVTRRMSRRLNRIGAVAPWSHVSGRMSWNNVRAITAWDHIGGPCAQAFEWAV